MEVKSLTLEAKSLTLYVLEQMITAGDTQSRDSEAQSMAYV